MVVGGRVFRGARRGRPWTLGGHGHWADTRVAPTGSMGSRLVRAPFVLRTFPPLAGETRMCGRPGHRLR